MLARTCGPNPSAAHPVCHPALQLVGDPLDKLVFKAVSRQMLGGRIKIFSSGGCVGASSGFYGEVAWP